MPKARPWPSGFRSGGDFIGQAKPAVDAFYGYGRSRDRRQCAQSNVHGRQGNGQSLSTSHALSRGLRETSVTEMFAKHPERVIELAVKECCLKRNLAGDGEEIEGLC